MQLEYVIATARVVQNELLRLKTAVELSPEQQRSFLNAEGKCGELQRSVEALTQNNELAQLVWDGAAKQIYEALKRCSNRMSVAEDALGIGYLGTDTYSATGGFKRKLDRVAREREVSECLAWLNIEFDRLQEHVFSFDLQRAFLKERRELRVAVLDGFIKLCEHASQSRPYAALGSKASHGDTNSKSESSLNASALATSLERKTAKVFESSGAEGNESLDFHVEQAERAYESLASQTKASNLTEAQKNAIERMLKKVWREWELEPGVCFEYVHLRDATGKKKKRIGAGSCANVYHGLLKAGPNRIPIGASPLPVAVKVFREEVLSVPSRIAFIRDADFLQRTRHPCIVHFYGASWLKDSRAGERGKIYASVVTELLKGSLHDAMRNQVLRKDQGKQKVLVDILEGLTFLHGRGVSRVDLRPTNILLRWSSSGVLQGRAKLCDFGPSHMKRAVLGNSRSIHRGAQRTNYTEPHVLAPECILRPDFPPQQSADMWNLGVTACAMYNANTPTNREGLAKLASIGGPSFDAAVAREVANVPSNLREIVGRCLSAEPSNRPTSEDFKVYLFFGGFSLHGMVDTLSKMDAQCMFDMARDKLLSKETDVARSLFSCASAKGSDRASFVCKALYEAISDGSISTLESRAQHLRQANLQIQSPEFMHDIVIGWMYESGIGGEQDIGEAHSLYTLAARNGSQLGSIELCRLCASSPNMLMKLSKRDRDTVLQAAQSGDISAQSVLTDCLSFGVGGFEQDQTQASIWMARIAEAGYPKAFRGFQTEQNTSIEEPTPTESSESDVQSSSDVLETPKEDNAIHRQTGKTKSGGRKWPSLKKRFVDSSTKSESNSVGSEKKPTEDQGAVELFKDARRLETGSGGVKKDLSRAMMLYELAADRGHATAMNNLGNMFRATALEVPKDAIRAMNKYEFAIARGHSGAMNNLGSMLLEGLAEVPKDTARAKALFEMAAEKGHPAAHYNLGRVYENGADGIPQDASHARTLYETAVDMGSCDAMFHLGYMLEQGNGGVQKDVNRAQKLYEAAAAKGHSTAMNNLGIMLEHGEGGVARDAARAKKMYEMAVAKGNSDAMFNLGYLMQQGGEGVAPDAVRAKEVYKLAVQKGHAGAMANLGFLLQHGAVGVPKDIARAKKMYEMAAEHGQSSAIVNLGFLYHSGAPGVPVDLARAKKLYERAVAMGESGGMNNLGFLLHHAAGSDRTDLIRAKELYEMAVAQGNPHAMVNLETLLYHGTANVPIDRHRALVLYNTVVEQGYSDVLINVGELYERGRLGVQRNLTEAGRLYKMASSAGNLTARKLLENGFERNR